MVGDLRELINIGPGVEKQLYLVGIKTKDEFLKYEPFEIFNKMLKINPTLPKPMLASLVGAKENVLWYLIIKDVVDDFEKKYPSHKWTKYQKNIT